MTTKDYALIAEVINNLPWSEKVRAITATRMARALQRDNSRFDQDLFMEACGFVRVPDKTNTYIHKSRARLLQKTPT